MEYIVGAVTQYTPEGRPHEMSAVQPIESVNGFEDALRLAESITRNYDDLGHENAVEYIITTDRALQNVSEQHPELDAVWSSHDSRVLRNCYTNKSPEEWRNKEDHSYMFEAYSDKPSVYFDIDGTLGKWYADGRGYSSLEEIIDPANHYFRDIEPHPYMVMLAEELQKRGQDVCIISAADRDTIRDKMEWIHENLPFIEDSNVFFSPLGADKTKFIKDNAEISVLIDDYNVNLEAWKGQAIKAINTVNSHQDKYPEIDMTVPENMMQRNGKRVLEVEGLIEQGELPETAVEDIKMLNAVEIAHHIERACETVEKALEDAMKNIEHSKVMTDVSLAPEEPLTAEDIKESYSDNDYYEALFNLDDKERPVVQNENGYTVEIPVMPDGESGMLSSRFEPVVLISTDKGTEILTDDISDLFSEDNLEYAEKELKARAIEAFTHSSNVPQELKDWCREELTRLEGKEESRMADTKIEPRPYEWSYGEDKGTSNGFTVTTSDGSKVAFVTEENDKAIPPRMFAESLGEPEGEMKKHIEEVGAFYGKSKQNEAACGEALHIIAESPDVPAELRAWAADTITIADDMIQRFEENGFNPIDVESSIGTVEIRAYSMQGLGREPESIRDIDGYTTDSDAIGGGGQNIYEYAAKIKNADSLQREAIQDKINLQSFYEEKILPLRDISREELTEEQRDNLSMYSDWHKDVHYHRPHGDDRDECYQHYLQKEAVKEEAMKEDVTSGIIALEEPMLEDSEYPAYVNFNVPMYDEGIQNLLDRTGILDKSVDFDNVQDIINSDTSVVNVYLDVTDSGGTRLYVDIDSGALTADVPLTGQEIDRLNELADSALAKDGGVKQFIQDNSENRTEEHDMPTEEDRDPLNKLTVIHSEKVEGLSVEMYGDGSGAAYLNGERIASVDLQTKEVQKEGKGWEIQDFGNVVETGMKKFAEFAESYAVEALGAREIESEHSKEIAEKAKEIISAVVEANPNGYSMYFNYDEKIAENDIIVAFEDYKEMLQKSSEPDYPTFRDYLESQTYEKWDMWERETEVLENDFYSSLDSDEKEIVQEYLDNEDITLQEALDNAGFAGVKYDLSEIVGEYKMNVMLTTVNEQNFDMGSIPSMFSEGDAEWLNKHLGGMTQEQQEKHFDNALTYLVYQQGHSLTEIAEGYLQDKASDNEFVKSVVDELNEFPSYSMAEVTALVKLDNDGLDVLDQIAKGEGDITFSKDTMIGLYNEWNGTGSQLEIQLEKPLTVSADMVRNVQIEGQKSDYIHGYTVNDTYGLIGSCWKGEISKSEESSKGVEITKAYLEDLSKVKDIIKEAAQPEKPKVKQQGVEM